ncbi:peptidylprolyl isomerase [Rhodocista pekingensis]|uniref:peptidylprolyl isomerase n=1 Tax=Rhodocista pekingensis TaxID=201185 RepID=A0ABW2KX83_9PROT
MPRPPLPPAPTIRPAARLSAALLSTALLLSGAAAAEAPARGPTVSEVIAAAAPGDWRGIDPESTLVMELASGPVILELAPALAPLHGANIRALVREGYFDGLTVVRVQDNYVAQWGDPEEEDGRGSRPIRTAKAALPPEFVVRDGTALPFDAIPGPDAYAPETGFVGGFPAARNPKTGEVWGAHCYGTVGVSRGDPDSGSGAGLYAVIGHAPRHLDRNITVVGRVLEGIERLSSLPRGTGPLGFYETAAERAPILRVRLVADMPAAERPALQVLKTGTPTWDAYVDARRNRRDPWFVEPAGAADVCNTLPPVRRAP